jgi:hypothetical protein
MKALSRLLLTFATLTLFSPVFGQVDQGVLVADTVVKKLYHQQAKVIHPKMDSIISHFVNNEIPYELVITFFEISCTPKKQLGLYHKLNMYFFFDRKLVVISLNYYTKSVMSYISVVKYNDIKFNISRFSKVMKKNEKKGACSQVVNYQNFTTKERKTHYVLNNKEPVILLKSSMKYRKSNAKTILFLYLYEDNNGNLILDSLFKDKKVERKGK